MSAAEPDAGPRPRVFADVAEMRTALGQELGPSRWVEITQERVDDFARTTGDDQWIHVDVERARSGPFGTTIAHGYLTLSLVALFAPDLYEVTDLRIGLNYGLDRLRFPAPVPVGSRLRARATVVAADDTMVGDQPAVRFLIRFLIEIEGYSRPACVADVIYLLR